jgi:hypothetical protein
VVVDRPAGRSVTFTGAAAGLGVAGAVRQLDDGIGVGDVQVSPTSAMPKGESGLQRTRCAFGHAVAIGVAQQVMRLALGTPAPARFITSFMIRP